jgi:hypothetical protein
LGVAALALAVAALALGAMRLRGRMLNGWSGPPARLADAILTLALLILTAELLGAVGMFKRVPLVAACLAIGLGMRFAVRPPRHGAGNPPAVPPSRRWGNRVAALIAALVVAHWSIGTVSAFGSGMTGYDSAWYHMPFAAHLAQTGSTLDFAFVSPRYLSWFYPQNSELLHGVGIVLTQSDGLSPALNLLWLVGCLGAAWCIGRPYGMGPWTVASAAVVLDAGLMADQAGEARNDTLALFFLLAAVAFLVNGAAAGGGRRIPPGPLAMAGLAAGLAAGTKLSFLAPVAALLIGATVLAASGRRRAGLAFFGAPMVAGCGFWYLRNLLTAGNPLPWLKAVGPLQLDGPDQGLGGRPQHSVLHYIGDGRIWNDWIAPALGHRLGELWPLVLGVAALAVIAALIWAPRPLKLIAGAAAAGAIAYLIEGTSAEGPTGTPVGFASSLRHLLPALCLALVLAPLLPGLRSRRGRIATATLLAVLLVADRSSEPWPLEYVVLALVLGTVGPALLAVRNSDLRRPLPRPAIAVASTAAIGALIAGGWFAQRSYLNERYDGDEFRSAGLNAAFSWASRMQDQRIATTLPLQYPLYGADLSNRVRYVGRRLDDGGFVEASTCASWLDAINRGRFDYLVVNDRPRTVDRDSSDALMQSGARLVFERNLIEVFRLDGPLGQSACWEDPKRARSTLTRGTRGAGSGANLNAGARNAGATLASGAPAPAQ